MAQQINVDHHPEAGQAGGPLGSDTAQDAVADAELMVWGAKAALNVAERNLRVAYETLASVLGARDNEALGAHKSAGLAAGPGDDSSEPDAPG